MSDLVRIVATVVRKNERGFGFLRQGTGEQSRSAPDIFFHASDLEGVTFDQLYEGAKVSFVLTNSDRGPRAASVRAAA